MKEDQIKQNSFFDDLEKLNDREAEVEYKGKIEWLELSCVSGNLRENRKVELELEKDMKKFSTGDRVVLMNAEYESAVTGQVQASISRVKSKTDEELILSKEIEGFGTKVRIFRLVFWNVPYPEDLIESQSRELAALDEKEQSLALKLSSPKISKEASSVSRKLQSGEITKEDAQEQLGELALGSGSISAESLAEFNHNTYIIRIQRAETYMGMPEGFLSLLDSLRGLPKQRFLNKFDEIMSSEDDTSGSASGEAPAKKPEPLKLTQSELLTPR